MNRLCQIQTSLYLGNILLTQFLNKYTENIVFFKSAPNFAVWDREQFATTRRRIIPARWHRPRGGRAAADQIRVCWILDYRCTRFYCPIGLNFTICVLHRDLPQILDVIRLFHRVDHRVRLVGPVIVYRSAYLWIMRDLVLVMCEQMGTFNNLRKSLFVPQYLTLLPTRSSWFIVTGFLMFVVGFI